ncbi:hypothetical protein ADL26_04670 [Thermoactinomyces vulgaris]|nr:hypothetical protein ADL26_04670 [Thermoactinomyces vulgaris]
MEEGVEQALGPFEAAAGALADLFEDRVPVALLLGEDAEDQGGRRGGDQVFGDVHEGVPPNPSSSMP